LDSKVKICSIENEINHNLLNIRRNTIGLSAAMSYTSKINDYRNVIKMATLNPRKDISSLISDLSVDSSNIPLAIQNLLGKIRKKDSVLILANDLDFKYSISTIISSSEVLNIVDMEVKSFSDIENIIYESPDIIIIDEDFNINGDQLSIKKLKSSLTFNHLIIGLSENLDVIQDGFLYDKVIYKRSKLLVDEIISFSHSHASEITYSENVVRIGKSK
jgi:hypothetical protein